MQNEKLEASEELAARREKFIQYALVIIQLICFGLVGIIVGAICFRLTKDEQLSYAFSLGFNLTFFGYMVSNEWQVREIIQKLKKH